VKRAADSLVILLVLTLAAGMLAPGAALAQEDVPAPVPGIGTIESLLTNAQDATSPDRISTSLLLLFLLTILSLAPSLLVMTTSFTRIIVVLGFLRQAMATQQTPPNQVLIGLALFLTFFIMSPTYQRVFDESVQPYMQEEIGWQEAVDLGVKPMREFMFSQVRDKDVALFLNITAAEPPDDYDDIATTVLIPAFIVSELRIAFQIGFLIYIPFLIIDMVVASTLMAMGMMMLPPVFVSLPFKIIMFVLADGWGLLIEELVTSFN
jgi:flagellar biosynthesis protein FliP